MNRKIFNLNVMLGAFFGSMCWSIQGEENDDDNSDAGIVALHGQKFSFDLVYSEDGIVESFRIERMYPSVATVDTPSVDKKDTEELRVESADNKTED